LRLQQAHIYKQGLIFKTKGVRRRKNNWIFTKESRNLYITMSWMEI